MTDLSTTRPPEVTADELRTALDTGRPVHVLDIRPREQFEEWHVPGSRHIGGYEALKEGRSDVYADLTVPDDGPLVTVCGAGKTSAHAARQLRKQGKDAYSLKGGLQAWTFAWNAAAIRFPDASAEVIQIRRTGKGCLSYLIGSRGEALVIDPALSPAIYEEHAERHGWTVTGVLDTHVHADHLSRARRLAASTGALLYLPKQERVSYAYRPLADGDGIEVGDATVRALHTPGHTPESMTYQLGERALFTGDTLFLQGVGRPDLDASHEEGRRKARALYRSLQRLMRLPGKMTVLPGHTSRPIAFDEAVVSATLDEVKAKIEVLQESEEQFVENILDRIPPTPPNHETIIARNETGDWPDEEDLVALEAGANRCAVG